MEYIDYSEYTNTELNIAYRKSSYDEKVKIGKEIQSRLLSDLYDKAEILDLYTYYPIGIEKLLIRKAIDNNIYLSELANIKYPSKDFTDIFLGILLSDEELYIENYIHLINEEGFGIYILHRAFQQTAVDFGSKYLVDNMIEIALDSNKSHAISSLPLDKKVFSYLMNDSRIDVLDDYVYSYVEYFGQVDEIDEKVIEDALEVIQILDGYNWERFFGLINDGQLESFLKTILNDQV